MPGGLRYFAGSRAKWRPYDKKQQRACMRKLGEARRPPRMLEKYVSEYTLRTTLRGPRGTSPSEIVANTYREVRRPGGPRVKHTQEEAGRCPEASNNLMTHRAARSNH